MCVWYVCNWLCCDHITYLHQERLVSVTYGLLRQGKFGFVATLREGLLGSLKVKAREVSAKVLYLTRVYLPVYLRASWGVPEG